MKIKELFSITENKRNKQINASLRKKKLNKCGLSMDEFLNMKIKKLK